MADSGKNTCISVRQALKPCVTYVKRGCNERFITNCATAPTAKDPPCDEIFCGREFKYTDESDHVDDSGYDNDCKGCIDTQYVVVAVLICAALGFCVGKFLRCAFASDVWCCSLDTFYESGFFRFFARFTAQGQTANANPNQLSDPEIAADPTYPKFNKSDSAAAVVPTAPYAPV